MESLKKDASSPAYASPHNAGNCHCCSHFICIQSSLGWDLSPDTEVQRYGRVPASGPLLPSTDMANLSLHDHDGSSGASDQDTLAPLPHPGAAPWPMAFPYQYPPPPHPYNPHPGFPELGYSYGGGSASSQHSEGKGGERPR